MTQNKPTISVVMPVNRDDGFLDLAVKSILNQTYDNFELIIVANGCSNELWEQILSYTDHRIRHHRLTLGGLCFALNFGINISHGEYIARMDADDISTPIRLDIQLRHIQTNPHIDVLGARCRHINASGELIDQTQKHYISHNEIIDALPFRNPLTHPVVLMKKSALIEAGGYKYGYCTEDYELWLRLMLLGKKFYNLDDNLLLYRIHDSQITNSDSKNKILQECSAILLLYFLKTKKIRLLIGSIIHIPIIRSSIKRLSLKANRTCNK